MTSDATSGSPSPLAMMRPRTIDGCSAVLLPFLEDGAVDWSGFTALLQHTIDAGLRPAVNMDTGHVHLLEPRDKAHVLDLCAAAATPGWFAGAVVRDQPGDTFDAKSLALECETIARRGGVPVVFPSFGLASLDPEGWLAAHQGLGEQVETFVAFELGTMFHPAGRIVDLDTYAALLEIQACVGAKHSSLEREPEWARLALRDRIRPGFHVFTGNDLAIDMVMFGSDYLLGLSTFAPDAFAARDRMWADGDPGFFGLNDVLQYLGQIAFRSPVPGYRHTAGQFLHLRGWLTHANAAPGEPRRPDSDLELLRPILERLELLMRGAS
jgi:dihydrodipicolinate synthase/N-acetylneuraminate lyase